MYLQKKKEKIFDYLSISVKACVTLLTIYILDHMIVHSSNGIKLFPLKKINFYSWSIWYKKMNICNFFRVPPTFISPSKRGNDRERERKKERERKREKERERERKKERERKIERKRIR